MAHVIVALDQTEAAPALDLVDAVGPAVSWYKVGARLFTAAGPRLVASLRERGKRVFLDLKYLDIPNTVEGAVRAAAGLGVDLLTVHATGGGAMLRAAAEGAGDTGTEVVAVTLLTSLTGVGAAEAWGREAVVAADEVSRLAALVAASGVAGVVCAVPEAARVRAERGSGFRIVTPGIRMPGDAADDQKRVATPGDAVRAGADYLVVGRSITGAEDPARAAEAVLEAAAQGVAA